MKFILETEHIMDPELEEAIKLMLFFKAKSWPVSGGGAAYLIEDPATYPIAEGFIPLALSKQVTLQGYTLYCPVANSVTDNKVPSSWPHATMTDPDDPEKVSTKRFDQYTRVVYGNDDESLIDVGHWPTVGVDGIFTSLKVELWAEEVKRFVDYLVSGDCSRILFGSTYQTWLVANTNQEL